MPAMQDLELDVTQLDIDEGQPHNCNGCPIALAAIRQLDADNRRLLIEVDGLFIFVCDLDARTHDKFRLSAEAQQFVTHFDEFGATGCQPFTFTARYVEPDLP
jgi:hypothetical protein